MYQSQSNSQMLQWCLHLQSSAALAVELALPLPAGCISGYDEQPTNDEIFEEVGQVNRFFAVLAASLRLGHQNVLKPLLDGSIQIAKSPGLN
ncbi:MAG: hypothetical protein SFZ03_07040 [Candidatus Melainabacteria bacterium]|nr:hypothetical protein [Candidatus Melainabacteria bacterium]